MSATAAILPASNAPGAVPANAEHRYTVTRADLPLSCPMPAMSLWNSHPKVYLPVEALGTTQCPYCAAVYTLVE
ncbi:MAG: zinc-finger domain-containing protein [Rudaea sp.]